MRTEHYTVDKFFTACYNESGIELIKVKEEKSVIRTINHPKYGEIIYTENEWTGKKGLKINGVEATKTSKKIYTVDDMSITLKGSAFLGATLTIDGEIIEIIPKSKWYEIVLAIFPFLFIMVWGSISSLCAIFPIVGGAIGGLIGGIGLVCSMYAMKRTNSVIKKILIGIAWIVLSILVAYLVALAIINTLGTDDGYRYV